MKHDIVMRDLISDLSRRNYNDVHENNVEADIIEACQSLQLSEQDTVVVIKKVWYLNETIYCGLPHKYRL